MNTDELLSMAWDTWADENYPPEEAARFKARLQWERDRVDAKRAKLRKDMADALLLATCDPRLRVVRP